MKKPTLFQRVKCFFGIHPFLKLVDMQHFDGFRKPVRTGTFTYLCIVCKKPLKDSEEEV